MNAKQTDLADKALVYLSMAGSKNLRVLRDQVILPLPLLCSTNIPTVPPIIKSLRVLNHTPNC